MFRIFCALIMIFFGNSIAQEAVKASRGDLWQKAVSTGPQKLDRVLSEIACG